VDAERLLRMLVHEVMERAMDLSRRNAQRNGNGGGGSRSSSASPGKRVSLVVDVGAEEKEVVRGDHVYDRDRAYFVSGSF
jgi:hypothetical protein